MKFDARAVKLLKPGEHYTVDGCPGLRVEATNSGRSWTYRYKHPETDRMKQVKLGSWPAMPFAEAVGLWHDAKSRRDSGIDPAAEKRSARLAATSAAAARKHGEYRVADVCSDYLAGHVARNRKEKGAQEIRRMFDTMLGDVAGRRADSITRSDAFDLIDSFAHIPVQAGKLRQELGAAWDYALDAGRIPADTPNWWRLILRGKLKSKGKQIAGKPIGTTKRALSEQEVKELMAWLPNFTRLVEDVLTLYLWTGARGSEITAMHANEITEEPTGLWWTLPKSKTKNANRENAGDLRIPLLGRAAEVVRRRRALYPGGQLFPSSGRFGYVEQKTIQTAVHYHQPYSRTRPECDRPRLTVTHWAPHDLRRTSRTLLAAMGCPREVGEVVLGHMLPGVEGVYNRHAYDKERLHWLSRLDAKLRELSSATPADSHQSKTAPTPAAFRRRPS